MGRGSYIGGGTKVRIHSDRTWWDNFDPYSDYETEESVIVTKTKPSNKKKKLRRDNKQKTTPTPQSTSHKKRVPQSNLALNFISQYTSYKVLKRGKPINPPKIFREEIINHGNIEGWINADQNRREHYNLQIEKYKKQLSIPTPPLTPKIKPRAKHKAHYLKSTPKHGNRGSATALRRSIGNQKNPLKINHCKYCGFPTMAGADVCYNCSS